MRRTQYEKLHVCATRVCVTEAGGRAALPSHKADGGICRRMINRLMDVSRPLGAQEAMWWDSKGRVVQVTEESICP